MSDPGIGESTQGVIIHDELPEAASRYLGVPELGKTDSWNLKTVVGNNTKDVSRTSTIQLIDTAPRLQTDVVFAKFVKGDVKPGKPFHLEAKPDKDYFWNRTLVHYDQRGRVIATTEATNCGDQDVTGGETKRVTTFEYTPDGLSRKATAYIKDGDQWREEGNTEPYFVDNRGLPNNARNDGGTYLNSTPLTQAA